MAQTEYSQEQINAAFANFAQSPAPENLIKYFFCGNPEDYRNPDKRYPLLMIQPGDVTTSGEEASIYYDYEICVVDRVISEGSSSNENHVFSDCLKILNDFKAYFTYSRAYDFKLMPETVSTKVGREINSDNCVGYLSNVRVKSYWSGNICVIPGINPPLAFSSGSYEAPVYEYLTCQSLTSCTQFQNYVAQNSSNLTFSAATNPGLNPITYNLTVERVGNTVTYTFNYDNEIP